jgi:DNA-binding XRE family transcriptional regulator
MAKVELIRQSHTWREPRGWYAAGMDARDFRGLGRPAQEALRRRALYLVERAGMTQAQAALAVGVHRQTVNIWLKRYNMALGELPSLDVALQAWLVADLTVRPGRLANQISARFVGWIGAATDSPGTVDDDRFDK